MIVAHEKVNYSYDEVQEARTSKKDRAVRERGMHIPLVAMVISAFLLGAAFSYVNALAVSVGYRVEGFRAEIEKLDTENQSLRTAVDKRDSLARVEMLAVTRLGMVHPTPDDVMFVAIGGENPTSSNTDSGPSSLATSGPEPDRQTSPNPEPDVPAKRTGVNESGMLQAFLDLIVRPRS